MKDITEILKSLRNVRLDAQEKSAMRGRLVQHIGSAAPIPSPIMSWYSVLWSHQLKVAYAVLFITLSVSSTVVFAAEQALPGDILYAVKTKVNEQVERAFVPSEPIQLAQFETKLVERRFEEAEKLDEKKQLVKEDTKNKAREEIEKQAEKAERAIAKTRVSKQVQIASADPAKEMAQPAAKSIENTMMIQSFSAPERDDKNDNEDNDKSDEDKSDEKSFSKRGKSFGALSQNENNDSFDNNDDNHDSREDSDLEKVFKKHSDIVKKLDIKKNNRSRDDR